MKPLQRPRQIGGAGEPPPEGVVPERGAGLGTFGGVFTPSILTILGVIMYLRFGWVVGQVGLSGTLLIVTLATAITFLTGLSISAIATDQRVRVGGAYYMISRALGIEAGGAVGLPLYIAQALSLALYTTGFAESLARVFPSLNQTAVGLVTTVLVTAVALLSVRAAIRAQYVIMGAIALSLLSFLFGHPMAPGPTAAAALPSASFWVVFAVFFPAVTGIMAGVNLSGDLREPRRAIPLGTLAAILVGFVIYMIVPVLLFLRADTGDLIADPLIMRRIAFWGDAILLGVWGATLSSAVGSVLGAPRVLQALARDGVLPRALRWLGNGSGKDDTPRLGTLLTLAVALVAVGFGNLNAIAPVLTMFFLTTYGVLNVVAGLERFLNSPSFRPTFKVHWSLSLLGAVGCVAVVVFINLWATLVAVVVAAVYGWLVRRALASTWGDVRQGVWMRVARAGILRLDQRADVKNWRPHMLVFSGAPTRRWYLIELANALAHDKALLSVATVLSEEGATHERQLAMEGTLREYLAQRGVQALLKVVRAPNPFSGMKRLVEAYGLGPLVPNTVMLGGSERDVYLEDFAALVTHIYRSRRNQIIVHHDHERGFGRRRRIDVWWGGLRDNGGLLVTLAYLLQSSLPWKGAEVCLKMVVPDPEGAEGAERNIQEGRRGFPHGGDARGPDRRRPPLRGGVADLVGRRRSDPDGHAPTGPGRGLRALLPGAPSQDRGVAHHRLGPGG